MAYNKDIVERLSQFNNLSFTKKQWDIILKGCGCPKSSHFWGALRKHNLVKEHKYYTLVDIDTKSYERVYTAYSTYNTEAVMKAYNKRKAKEKARQSVERLQSKTLYIINGYITDTKPTIE